MVGIILGEMDSATLIINKKPYNRVNGGEQLTGNTSLDSRLLTLLDEQGGKMSLRQHSWKAGLRERDFT